MVVDVDELILSIDIENLKEIAKKSNDCGKKARKKLRILERDGFKCTNCGRKDHLTIAHKTPIRVKNRSSVHFKLNECITLCVRCHIYLDSEKGDSSFPKGILEKR